MSNLLVDGHVHLHPGFAMQALLDAALANFTAAARVLGLQGRTHYVLLLCETAGSTRFRGLLHQIESSTDLDGWSFSRATEPDVIVANHSDSAQLFIIAGRQIETREGLEVLALCTSLDHPDGQDTDATIASVRGAGAIAVLPWGFGKWRGRRGAIVADLVRRTNADDLLLGDNSGRLGLAPEPPQFAVARGFGKKILAGTDPLPFGSQLRRVGAYGSSLRGPFAETEPTASMKSLLRSAGTTLTTYGSRERLLPFLANQTRMQMRKRLAFEA